MWTRSRDAAVRLRLSLRPRLHPRPDLPRVHRPRLSPPRHLLLRVKRTTVPVGTQPTPDSLDRLRLLLLLPPLSLLHSLLLRLRSVPVLLLHLRLRLLLRRLRQRVQALARRDRVVRVVPFLLMAQLSAMSAKLTPRTVHLRQTQIVDCLAARGTGSEVAELQAETRD